MTLATKIRLLWFCVLLLLVPRVWAQGTVPTFQRTLGGNAYTMAGHDPAVAGTTTVPVLLVPITLTFEGHSERMSAEADVARVLESPIFKPVALGGSAPMQYGDALLHATFPQGAVGHTVLEKPEVQPITIDIPAGNGYLLHSRKNGGAFAVVDSEYVQKDLFRQIPWTAGKLIVAFTHNTTYFADADATVCCTWGTHGIDWATGDSFVLGTYIANAPAIVTDRDVQPLTQQLGEYFNDPKHDPRYYFKTQDAPGNFFPPWRMGEQDEKCGGSGVGTNYFLLEPTNTNAKNGFPASPAFTVKAGGFAYHLQNVALLHWYLNGVVVSGTFSFPDTAALKSPAEPCMNRREREATRAETASALPQSGAGNEHKLIGYWTGSRFGEGSEPFRLKDVSPQWDVILAAFASPDPHAPDGVLRYEPPPGIAPDELKADIALLKSQGKTVMISLGGGGQYFKLNKASEIPGFVSSVAAVISEYGFEGVDIDFETPSLALDPGDTDFKHPTTPSVVNLIAGLRELREKFGPGFKISLVPEGSQIPGGYATYGGQFGSYLPLIWGLKDILTFVDVQDYNTPPMDGLDGEIYESNSVDYHAAMTELLLRGFYPGGKKGEFFPGLPADKVAVGFLTDYNTPEVVDEAMRYLVTGKMPADAKYRLREPRGYPALIGAMFWTIDDDRREGFRYSNRIGPELQSSPAQR
ncbi:glycosyl hydrolase family 18 protein [Acidicapsa dinghuensis]|uniref:Glycosyl hydrolase family 18 protein n=1 Tax=Acidicapsa dinghuensis TaxID=2218256 RepID=A0ABW1EL25_9BACT